MYVFSRFSRAGFRFVVSLLLTVALFSSTVGTLFAAGTTGSINGTVTDATGAPVDGVTVTATSPTGQFKATTNAKGFFAILGISPDTFIVSFTKQGFEQQQLTGINIVQDGSTELNVKLSKALKTVATVSARGKSGAYQPDQTQDTYTLGQDQITTAEGRDKNTSESNLLGSLPGASFDSSGYPVLRGGRENEEGYQFEGVPIVDSFTNQFTNSLSVNGINSFQLTPGAGNASNGNAGTGAVNFTVKRGTYPGFGSFEGEAESEVFAHQISLEYGIANPSGTISNYASFIGQRYGNQVGPQGYPAVLEGEYNGGEDDFQENNFVDNLVIKFGQNKSYELQALVQNQIDRFGFNYGGLKGVYPELGDPYFTGIGGNYESFLPFLGFTIPEVAGAIANIPGVQNNYNTQLGQSAQYQPEDVVKLALAHSFNSSTYAKLTYYGVDATSYFSYIDPNLGGITAEQGGLKHGVLFDIGDQFNSKNLFQAGLKYEYSHPIFSERSADFAALGAGVDTAFGFGLGTQGFEFADFLPPTDANCNAILSQEFGAVGGCGYLSKYFPNGVKVPNFVENSPIDESDYAAYFTDDYSPTKALKIEAGLRLDGARTFYPTTYDDVSFSIPNKDARPLIPEPRVAVTYQLSKRDVIRASYGRSTQVPGLGLVADTVDPTAFSKFYSVPSYNVLTGMPATICGPTHTSTCPNYGQQLFTEYQFLAGTPIQPVSPEIFGNFDFSYEHEFPEGIDVKITPFYTRGYDIVDQVANVIGVNPNTNAPLLGPALSTNLGIEKTSGIEFYLTKETKYGISGGLSATYINKLSNVPPLSSSEDFFPTIPTASLDLGNLYRVGYLSPFQVNLALEYKSKGGLRINPTINYNKGYPYNPGSLTAVFLNGNAVNVPNTNITGPENGLAPAGFVDPANPGTIPKPNIAATLGTPASAAAGGRLTNARVSANLTLEFSPPLTHSTFGLQINNLFDELYGRPALNTDIQPVSTGVFGPQTGQLKSYQVPYESLVPYLAPTPASEFGGLPYNILYSNSPTSVLFYYQLKL